MIWKQNLHQSTTLTKSQEALQAHGWKPWATNLSIIPPYIRYTNSKYYMYMLAVHYDMNMLIGASLSEPHTDETAPPPWELSIYVCLYRTLYRK